MPKYDFNFNNFIEITLRDGCSSLNLLHIFSTPFPRNTWTAASVSLETNFENWEKIRLDHDQNITIRRFFTVEPVIIITISQTT